jgi:hypothetical protein
MATRDSCFQAEAKFTCKAEMERREESLILAESQLPAFEKPTLNAGCPELGARRTPRHDGVVAANDPSRSARLFSL